MAEIISLWLTLSRTRWDIISSLVWHTKSATSDNNIAEPNTIKIMHHYWKSPLTFIILALKFLRISHHNNVTHDNIVSPSVKADVSIQKANGPRKVFPYISVVCGYTCREIYCYWNTPTNQHRYNHKIAQILVVDFNLLPIGVPLISFPRILQRLTHHWVTQYCFCYFDVYTIGQ